MTFSCIYVTLRVEIGEGKRLNKEISKIVLTETAILRYYNKAFNFEYIKI